MSYRVGQRPGSAAGLLRRSREMGSGSGGGMVVEESKALRAARARSMRRIQQGFS